MHSYGDKNFSDEMFFKVDNAAEMIGLFCAKWGRIPVRQYKEKFGTVRVYCSLYCDDLHGLLRPAYCWVLKPYRLWTFPFLRPFRFLIQPYQQFIYRLAYKRAIKKFPMIKEEILCCADWPEYLKGL